MFSALLGKGLKQQRAIVAAGIGTGLLFALLLWLAIGGLYGSRPVSAEDAIGSALSLVLALGIWPLWALLAFSQAFTGDRAAGTEPFLLDRPVPPRQLFVARLLAALAGWGAVAGGTFAMLWVLARTHGVATDGVLGAGGIGLAFSALAACSALLAAALGAVSLAAALLGLLLGLAALAVAFQLFRAFPVLFEALGWFTLWPAVLLVLAYPLVAWIAFTRGEPAGRGRTARAATVLALAVALIAVLFVAATPALIRAGYGTATGYFEVALAPGGGGAVLNAWRHLWIVDPATGARRRFIPPWSSFLGWRADGALFAVATRATRLGGESRRERIAFYDAAGGRAAPDVELGRDAVQIFGLGMDGGLWIGDELFFVTAADGEEPSLWRVRPGEAEGRLEDARLPALTRPLRGSSDGMLYLVSYPKRERASHPVKPSLTEDAQLSRFDPRTGVLTPLGPISPGRILYAGLAPSGRYWLVDAGDEQSARLVVRTMATGEESEYPLGDSALLEWEWLADDRLALVVEREGRAHLVLTGPGGNGAREELGSWPGRPAWGWLQASPDGSMLLVRDHATRRARVLHLADRRWSEIDAPAGAARAPGGSVPVQWRWAGERTLTVPGARGPLLIDVDDPSRQVAIAW